MRLGILCECLLLRAVPILVETSLQFVGEMLGPDGGERPQATRGLDIADEANDDHLMTSQRAHKSDNHRYSCVVETYRRGLNDSDSLNNLFLVHLRTRSIKVADDGGHPGLVSHGSGEMDWFLGVILWKAGNVSASTFSSHDFWITSGYQSYLLTLPRCLAALFRGRKASEPVRRNIVSLRFFFINGAVPQIGVCTVSRRLELSVRPVQIVSGSLTAI